MERSKKLVWAGRIVSGLPGLAFVMSGLMKLKGGPGVAQMFGHLGLSESLALPIALLELASVAIYLGPRRCSRQRHGRGIAPSDAQPQQPLSPWRPGRTIPNGDGAYRRFKPPFTAAGETEVMNRETRRNISRLR